MTDEHDIDIEKALLDPSAVFDSPAEIPRREDLSRDQKVKILRRWQYDAVEMQVAEEENMPGNEKPGLLLDRILAALAELGEGPESEHHPPTKHGGV